MTNVWKLLRLTTLLEFLPVLLVSLMALFTGLALLAPRPGSWPRPP